MTATELRIGERRARDRVFTEVTLVSASGVNPLSAPTVAQLRELLRAQAVAGTRHGVVLRAEGRAFCAGADVKEFRGFDAAAFRNALSGIMALYLEMIRFPQPIVSLVHADALGGGAALAFCSDYVVAARGAKFGLPEVLRGLAGGGWLMPRLLGKQRATGMVMFGRSLDADAAHRLGLVGDVCEAGELDARGQAVCDELAALTPAGLAVAKKSLAVGLGDDMERAMQVHVAAQTEAFAQSLVQAAARAKEAA